ncbi:hypothetical protein AVEN_157737-1 [Araneus ventricosus]|uniref:Uncharacterized protein n=1 Tax=Araneus ventricosus TaxID=182803 RepID=A0A4Y2HB72_ARAVE|nr:hypothetical protein AVEN_157737-1 [Araneus ventricosus]
MGIVKLPHYIYPKIYWPPIYSLPQKNGLINCPVPDSAVDVPFKRGVDRVRLDESDKELAFGLLSPCVRGRARTHYGIGFTLVIVLFKECVNF